MVYYLMKEYLYMTDKNNKQEIEKDPYAIFDRPKHPRKIEKLTSNWAQVGFGCLMLFTITFGLFLAFFKAFH